MGTTKKMLGDGGEHFTIGQLMLVGGHPVAKMPDNWKAYDLAVETGHGLARVSVKTRTETAGWKKSKWFSYDATDPFDWLVCVFVDQHRKTRAWVLPRTVASDYANKTSPTSKNPDYREISWKTLTTKLDRYENNWELNEHTDGVQPT